MPVIACTAVCATHPLKRIRDDRRIARNGAVATALVLWLGAAPAQAQSARTFVSGTGSDASAACSRAAPCRTFAVAISRTRAFGEITVLDPAGYGTVTITKSISIVNDGVGEAGIRPAPGGFGITISADPKAVINLRGLTIDGGGSGRAGIVFNTGAVLNIQNCVVRHLGDIGIYFTANASSNLAVATTLVADNAGGGIVVRPSGSGTVRAVFNRIEAYNNGSLGITEGGKAGIEIDGSASTGTVSATIADSVAANTVGKGYFVISASGQARTSVMLLRSVAANNDFGVLVQLPQAIVRSAQSTITGNATGWSATGGGVLQTYGDSYIDGNTVDGGLPPTIPTR